MNAPKVSVIVPVYNMGEKLVPSIESLLGQTLKDIEIILVNDASTDNTKIVIDRLAMANSNVVAMHFDKNKGVHEARLAGLKSSSARWIGFMDSDDFARPAMFSTLLSVAEGSGVDIVVCGSDRVTQQREKLSPKLEFQGSVKIENNVFERFCNHEFGTGMLWNKLFKRTVIEPWFNLHFPWRQRINEDLLLNLACFHDANSVFLLSDVLHEYVLCESSVTSMMEGAWAYVEAFRGYALAMTCFGSFGSQALCNIVDMYRAQLSWSCYQVSNTSELLEYSSELEEAVRLLYRENPFALSVLAAERKPSSYRRKAVRSSLIRIVKKLKDISRCRGQTPGLK